MNPIVRSGAAARAGALLVEVQAVNDAYAAAALRLQERHPGYGSFKATLERQREALRIQLLDGLLGAFQVVVGGETTTRAPPWPGRRATARPMPGAESVRSFSVATDRVTK
ncbi:hypothetical protein [Streptomyces adelaidensis]|uniref:hypothetical protein n=1 Tax=Streptomyces adelaidensis TaxID=2796465 RepID=UPI0019049B80|nr:hypothetical protein [Streptomyces adelaidensis]